MCNLQHAGWQYQSLEVLTPSCSAPCTDPDSHQRLRRGLEEAVSQDRWRNPGGEKLAEGLLRVWGKREGAHDRFHAALQQKQLQRSAAPTHAHLFFGLSLSEIELQMVPQVLIIIIGFGTYFLKDQRASSFMMTKSFHMFTSVCL